MFRIDGPGAVGELPPTRAGVSEPGYFGPGNPATGQMSTRVTYEWLNAVQEEIVSVIEAGGLEPDKARLTQLLAALRVLFAAPGDIIPPDGVTIRTVSGKLTVNVSATPANGRIPMGDATKHIPVGWVQDASTGQKGVAKLNNAINSTSTTEAATPAAVKAAYDAARSAHTVAAAKAPLPQAAAGVGQWVAINSQTYGFDIPAGGSWAYHVTVSTGSVEMAAITGVVAGGTHVPIAYPFSLGLGWRIA